MTHTGKIILLLLFIFISCKKKNVLTLNVQTNKIFINTKDKNVNTIINYSIENSTNDNFCLIVNPESKLIFNKKCIHLKNISAYFISKNDTAKVRGRFVNYEYDNCREKRIEELNKFSKNMNYKMDGYSKKVIDESLIIVPSKQKVFFETLIQSKKSNIYNESIELTKGKYEALFFIHSDSTNYKKRLPRNVLKTIDANNIKVYHGIIESSNKVPIKIIE